MCGFACAGQQKRHFGPGNGTSSGVDVRPVDVTPEDVRPEGTVLDSLAKDWGWIVFLLVQANQSEGG